MGKKEAKWLKDIYMVSEHYLICKKTSIKRGVINKWIILKIKGWGGVGLNDNNLNSFIMFKKQRCCSETHTSRKYCIFFSVTDPYFGDYAHILYNPCLEQRTSIIITMGCQLIKKKKYKRGVSTTFVSLCRSFWAFHFVYCIVYVVESINLSTSRGSSKDLKKKVKLNHI